MVRETSGAAHVAQTRQTISRTTERLHLRADDTREWLFRRNPMDPTRVSASLVDHRSRVIVIYDESDLRQRHGHRRLGPRPDAWNRSGAAQGPDTHGPAAHDGGIRFARYVGHRQDNSPSEIWWSEEYALPQTVVTKAGAGRTTFSIARISPGVNAEMLRRPTERFPEYDVVDLADWRDRH